MATTTSHVRPLPPIIQKQQGMQWPTKQLTIDSLRPIMVAKLPAVQIASSYGKNNKYQYGDKRARGDRDSVHAIRSRDAVSGGQIGTDSVTVTSGSKTPRKHRHGAMHSQTTTIHVFSDRWRKEFARSARSSAPPPVSGQAVLVKIKDKGTSKSVVPFAGAVGSQISDRVARVEANGPMHGTGGYDNNSNSDSTTTALPGILPPAAVDNSGAKIKVSNPAVKANQTENNDSDGGGDDFFDAKRDIDTVSVETPIPKPKVKSKSNRTTGVSVGTNAQRSIQSRRRDANSRHRALDTNVNYVLLASTRAQQESKQDTPQLPDLFDPSSGLSLSRPRSQIHKKSLSTPMSLSRMSRVEILADVDFVSVAPSWGSRSMAHVGVSPHRPLTSIGSGKLAPLKSSFAGLSRTPLQSMAARSNVHPGSTSESQAKSDHALRHGQKKEGRGESQLAKTTSQHKQWLFSIELPSRETSHATTTNHIQMQTTPGIRSPTRHSVSFESDFARTSIVTAPQESSAASMPTSFPSTALARPHLAPTFTMSRNQEAINERVSSAEDYMFTRSYYIRPKEVQPYCHVPVGPFGQKKGWRKAQQESLEWEATWDPPVIHRTLISQTKERQRRAQQELVGKMSATERDAIRDVDAGVSLVPQSVDASPIADIFMGGHGVKTANDSQDQDATATVSRSHFASNAATESAKQLMHHKLACDDVGDARKNTHGHHNVSNSDRDIASHTAPSGFFLPSIAEAAKPYPYPERQELSHLGDAFIAAVLAQKPSSHAPGTAARQTTTQQDQKRSTIDDAGIDPQRLQKSKQFDDLITHGPDTSDFDRSQPEYNFHELADPSSRTEEYDILHKLLETGGIRPFVVLGGATGLVLQTKQQPDELDLKLQICELSHRERLFVHELDRILRRENVKDQRARRLRRQEVARVFRRYVERICYIST